MKTVRAAAAIFHSPVNRVEHNLQRMTEWIQKAGKEGIQLFCFPELNISGYSIKPDIKDLAETIPGPSSRYLSDLAVRQKMVILAGMAERGQNGCIYASHMVLTPDGKTGVYRKLHIAPPEKGVFSAGDRVPVFEYDGIKFGIQLCYDAHFPELSTLMAAKGADVIFFPHASPWKTPAEKFAAWNRHLPARAYDNSLFVMACNQTGSSGRGLQFPGLAMALGPGGDILSKDISGREGWLVTDLEADALDDVRSHRMRYFFPNRRPDLYISLCAERSDR